MCKYAGMKNKESRIVDGHGYEVIGYDRAKSIKAKINCLKAHLRWLEFKEIDARISIEEKIKELTKTKLNE
jgi:hypothetical protein